ncbi:MAG: hypothetical protein ABSG46_20160 [Candidatus Binataceae bacterium]|jgi:hypothetical protein
MMQRIEGMTDTRPGPRPGEHKTKPSLKPFVAVDVNQNPWSMPREYQGTIPVTYGNIFILAQALTRGMSPDTKYIATEQRRLTRFPDGRAFKIELRIKEGTAFGGKIWIRDSKGRSTIIQDVKGLFQVNWPALKRLYNANDLAQVMEHTRSSLAEVNLRADQQDWYRCSSITGELWRRLQVNLGDVPCVRVNRDEPGNLQGYNVFGHTDQPVYFYDIHSAYLSVMAQFPALEPFTDYLWSARQELDQSQDPAAFVLKLAAVVIPGKFTSALPGNKFYRPILGQYIRQSINDRLRAAMNLIDGYYNRYRWCVDGFIASQDISRHLDVGDGLGQWKPVDVHSRLTIARTNVWWTDKGHKDNGYTVREQQVLDDPTEIHTSRTVFDWSTLSERTEPVTLYQNHYEEQCRACRDGGGMHLHDTLPRGIVL